MSIVTATSTPVIAEVDAGVLVLRLNRPAVRNAFDWAMALEMEKQIDRFEADESLRVAILTGGVEHFSAGVDLRAMAAGEPKPRTPQRGWFGFIERPPNKPLIAAVEGAAFGGGFERALACDLLVAAENSRFALPEVSRGLIASAGGLIRLPLRLPAAIAAEIVLTGEPCEARRLHAFGLINRLAPPSESLQAALTIARVIAANAPLSVAASKRMLRLAGAHTEAQLWRHQEEIFAPVRDSADYQEGLRAFKEKRRPKFSGR